MHVLLKQGIRSGLSSSTLKSSTASVEGSFNRRTLRHTGIFDWDPIVLSSEERGFSRTALSRRDLRHRDGFRVRRARGGVTKAALLLECVLDRLLIAARIYALFLPPPVTRHPEKNYFSRSRPPRLLFSGALRIRSSHDAGIEATRSYISCNISILFGQECFK